MGNRLIVATRNPDKLIELRRILEAGRVPVDVGDLEEYPDLPEIAETGLTFTENALLKARAVAAFTGLPAVADDSGLCADALNGMPGVLSARWSGRHGDDDANLQLVLGQLADVPDLLHEKGVLRELEALDAVGLQCEGPPDPRDRHVAQPLH